jgi:hypothetical protein
MPNKVAYQRDTDLEKDVSSEPLDKDGKVLHEDLLNPKVLKAQYAVRGELYLRGEELRQQGKQIIATNSELMHSSSRSCSCI